MVEVTRAMIPSDNFYSIPYRIHLVKEKWLAVQRYHQFRNTFYCYQNDFSVELFFSNFQLDSFFCSTSRIDPSGPLRSIRLIIMYNFVPSVLYRSFKIAGILIDLKQMTHLMKACIIRKKTDSSL